MTKLYNCEEVAERYDVKTSTVWEWIRKKKLQAIKVGKGYRISEEQLKTFENERTTEV